MDDDDDDSCECHIELATLSSNNGASFNIEEFIANLETPPTVTDLCVNFFLYESTPENIRQIIEPLCRCIANLRCHNKDSMLTQLRIEYCHSTSRNNFVSHSPHFRARRQRQKQQKQQLLNIVDQFLVAAKQYGILDLHFYSSRFRIQSLVEFCTGNTRLKFLHINHATISDEVSLISSTSTQDGTQDIPVVLALDKLTMHGVTFEHSLVASKFSDVIEHVTYRALNLGGITVGYDNDNDAAKEGNKIARLRIVSELLKPSVEQLTLEFGCRIDNMDAIETCATVTDIAGRSRPAKRFPSGYGTTEASGDRVTQPQVGPVRCQSSCLPRQRLAEAVEPIRQ